ncbi:unnamed protein product, partial [Effrenium voratum]
PLLSEPAVMPWREPCGWPRGRPRPRAPRSLRAWRCWSRAARLSDAMAAQVTSSMGRSWNLGAVAPAELDGTSLRKTRRFGRICSADRQRDCEAAAHGGREHAANFK